jgi:hypothetical protein
MKKLPIALLLSVLFVIAGCSSSSSGNGGGGGSASPSTSTSASTPSTPPSTPGAVATGSAGIALAKKDIKKNWSTFFNSNTPEATAVGLLQDGSTLGAAVKLAARVAKHSKLKETAIVQKITFAAGGTTANVTFNLYGKKGSPALLTDSPGVAVLDGGVWKVAKVTFCTLVGVGAQSLGIKKVPGCAL